MGLDLRRCRRFRDRGRPAPAPPPGRDEAHQASMSIEGQLPEAPRGSRKVIEGMRHLLTSQQGGATADMRAAHPRQGGRVIAQSGATADMRAARKEMPHSPHSRVPSAPPSPSPRSGGKRCSIHPAARATTWEPLPQPLHPRTQSITPLHPVIREGRPCRKGRGGAHAGAKRGGARQTM